MKNKKILLYLLVCICCCGCASNLPLRTSRTLPKGKVYQHFTVERNHPFVTATVEDSLVNFSNNSVGVTPSHRIGAYDWMEIEFGGLPFIPFFISGHLWLKFPLTKNSVGKGVPYVKNSSRFAASCAFGGFFFGGLNLGAETAVQGGVYSSYDLYCTSKRDIQIVLNTGIECCRGYAELDNAVEIENDEWAYYEYDFAQLYYTAFKIPVGIGIISRKFFVSIDYRYIIPLRSQIFLNSNSALLDYQNIAFKAKPTITFSVGYSFNIEKF